MDSLSCARDADMPETGALRHCCVAAAKRHPAAGAARGPRGVDGTRVAPAVRIPEGTMRRATMSLVMSVTLGLLASACRDAAGPGKDPSASLGLLTGDL